MIAVDIVLLSPDDVTEKAIELNREIVREGREEIVLDREKCLPHITLAMGCMKEEDIEKAGNVLSSIAVSFPPPVLKTVSIKGGKAWIEIEKNRDIELLHEMVMIRLSRFFSYDVSREMIYASDTEEINDLTLEYIRKFSISSTFENYTPHITLAHGDMARTVEPFEFTSSRLAICHLGNFCTCRKILLSWELRTPSVS